MAAQQSRVPACAQCSELQPLEFDFSMAFQPIVDMMDKSVYAYEALARGTAGEPAGTVFAHVNDSNRYRFDQACRVKAISQFSRHSMPALLSINFMPNAIYKPELCIRTTLQAAQEHDIAPKRIIFEMTEDESVLDKKHLMSIINYYRSVGFLTAIDDFGAGYAGLGLLADVQPDIVKIDMELVRGVDSDSVRRNIVLSIVDLCKRLSISVIAEGIETMDEYLTLRELGIRYHQGYFFAKPRFEGLPKVDFAQLY